jgi:hypothetical protein
LRKIRARREHGDKPGRATVRQRLDQRRIDEAKNRYASGDAEREDADGSAREPAMFEELTESETKVLHAVVYEVYVTHVPALLFSLVDPAERTQRRIARVIARHSSRDIGFDLPLEVVAELVVEAAPRDWPRSAGVSVRIPVSCCPSARSLRPNDRILRDHPND